MSSHDPGEAKLTTAKTARAVESKTAVRPVLSNYPPKAPFPDGALPPAHRPTSA